MYIHRVPFLPPKQQLSARTPSFSALSVVFPGDPGLACFIEAKDGGDNWSCKSVKSSQPTNPNPTFHRPDALPVAQPTGSKRWRKELLSKLWSILPFNTVERIKTVKQLQGKPWWCFAERWVGTGEATCWVSPSAIQISSSSVPCTTSTHQHPQHNIYLHAAHNHAAVNAGVKVGGNAWDAVPRHAISAVWRSQASKSAAFPSEPTFPGRFVCLFAWGLTALSAQIGYIAP